MNSKVTYRQQFTRCGKQRCRKCREGSGHGPYWYAYWSEKGRTVSKYIGVHLPKDVEGERQFTRDEEALPASHDGVQQPQDVSSERSVRGALSNKKLPAAPTLRIYLLGQFRIERKSDGEWHALDSRTWHRRRARALLGCLLSNTGRRLGREQIMEMLWPDLDIDLAANRLNGAVPNYARFLSLILHARRLRVYYACNETFLNWRMARRSGSTPKSLIRCSSKLIPQWIRNKLSTCLRRRLHFIAVIIYWKNSIQNGLHRDETHCSGRGLVYSSSWPSCEQNAKRMSALLSCSIAYARLIQPMKRPSNS